jgi:branched-chain amino acid transport system permease protein
MRTLTSLRPPTPGSGVQSGQAKIVSKTLKIVGLLALLAVALLFPLQISPDPATTGIAVLTLMFAAWTVAWNIFSGYTGYIALGHAAFFGTGAYALGVMCQRWHIGSSDVAFLFLPIPADYTPFLLVPLAGLVAGLIAVPLGWIALQTRRHTFIVITIAIFFVFQLLAENNIFSLTNGNSGFEFPRPTWVYPFYNFPFYYAMLAILLVALAVSWWVRHSKYGLGLLAIRDDEDRALGLGVKTGPSKLAAFVISALFVGMLGGIWGYFQYSISPQFAFDPLDDIAVALMGFLGGMGTLAGPIVGALILEPAQQYFTLYYGASGYYLIIYGALFLAIILLLPQGIVPTLRKWWSLWLVRRASSNAAPGVTKVEDQVAPVKAEQAEAGEGVNR